MLTIFAKEITPDIPNYEVVLVPMGINNSFNSGFRREVAANFEGIKEAEGQITRYGDRGKYGTISNVNMSGITFVFCYIDKGGYRGGDSIDYGALESCLKLVDRRYSGRKIGAPLMGYGKFDGNGDKERLLEIFKERFGEENTKTNVDLFVFESDDRKLRFFREIAELRNRFKKKEITSDEYRKKRSEIEWRRKNGIFRKMPEGYEYRPKNSARKKAITVKKRDLQ